jgi:hypothetical protein
MSSHATEVDIFNTVRQEPLFREVKEYGDIDVETCIDEVKGQIWGKALRLYALDKEREGDNWRENYGTRFLNLLGYNEQEVLVLKNKDSNKESYVEVGWKLASTEVNDEGFGINVSLREDEDTDEEDSPILNVEFAKEEYLERDEEEREVYLCILETLEQESYE